MLEQSIMIGFAFFLCYEVWKLVHAEEIADALNTQQISLSQSIISLFYWLWVISCLFSPQYRALGVFQLMLVVLMIMIAPAFGARISSNGIHTTAQVLRVDGVLTLLGMCGLMILVGF